jgi:steroid delta-isomerase-like uncharacterized protein
MQEGRLSPCDGGVPKRSSSCFDIHCQLRSNLIIKVREGMMKKHFWVVPSVLLLCFVVNCQDKAAMAELEKYRAQAKLEEQNKEIVKRFLEGLNKGNVEIMDELYAPEHRWYYSSTTPNPMSRKETIEFFRMFLKAFPDANWTVQGLFPVGDRVIAWLTVRGTHKGEFQGILATGNRVEFNGFDMFRIQNGKIVEEREETDMLSLYQQLGMELKPVEAKKK